MTTHIERITACLAGETPDRPPVALWRHFPVDDQTAAGLASATLNFQKTYDFDLVKVTPASSFCLKDWGVDDEWRGDPEGTRAHTKYIIQQPGDWERLPALDPASAPHLAAQVECLSLIKRELPDTPVLQTIFNPLSQAKNLAGEETLLAHLRLHPESVMRGLETIAATTRRFIEACAPTGIDGIFYAIQHAQGHLLSPDEFQRFSRTQDLSLLAAAGNWRLNMAHIHGKNILFEQVVDYPVQILNWHDRETEWSLAGGQKRFKGIVCGGIRQDTLVFRDAGDVHAEAADALAQTHGRRMMIGTGCVVPIMASHGNLLAARRSVEKA